MFNWDAANVAHIAEHNVTPAEAEQVVMNSPFDISKQHRNGEERLMQVGETASGRVLLVITTLRLNRTRVVTAFPANRSYRAYYNAQKAKMNKDGSNPS